MDMGHKAPAKMKSPMKAGHKSPAGNGSQSSS